MTVSPGTVYRGGVSIDLEVRRYGRRRWKATYPVGRLKVTEDCAQLWIKRIAIPRDLPLPMVLMPDAVCVFVRRNFPPGITFKTTTTAHHFWTLHPRRIFEALKAAGFGGCT